jgi:hypothetical protein
LLLTHFTFSKLCTRKGVMRYSTDVLVAVAFPTIRFDVIIRFRQARISGAMKNDSAMQW